MDTLLNQLISKHSLASMGVPLYEWTPDRTIDLQEEMILACKENWDEWLADESLARDYCFRAAMRIATDDRLPPPPPPPKLTHTVNLSGNLGMFVNPFACSCETCVEYVRGLPTPTPATLCGPPSEEPPPESLRADAAWWLEKLCLYCNKDPPMYEGDDLCADCFWELDHLYKKPGRLSRSGADQSEIDEAIRDRDEMLDVINKHK
jgi:hypothetical protein